MGPHAHLPHPHLPLPHLSPFSSPSTHTFLLPTTPYPLLLHFPPSLPPSLSPTHSSLFPLTPLLHLPGDHLLLPTTNSLPTAFDFTSPPLPLSHTCPLCLQHMASLSSLCLSVSSPLLGGKFLFYTLTLFLFYFVPCAFSHTFPLSHTLLPARAHVQRHACAQHFTCLAFTSYSLFSGEDRDRQVDRDRQIRWDGTGWVL